MKVTIEANTEEGQVAILTIEDNRQGAWNRVDAKRAEDKVTEVNLRPGQRVVVENQAVEKVYDHDQRAMVAPSEKQPGPTESEAAKQKHLAEQQRTSAGNHVPNPAPSTSVVPKVNTAPPTASSPHTHPPAGTTTPSTASKK